MNTQWLLAIVIAWSAAYILLSPVIAAPLYNSMLCYPNYPSRYDEKAYSISQLDGIAKKDLRIEVPSGKTIHAWYFHNTHSDGLVLIHHGNAGNISNRIGLVDDLLKLGYSVLLYDYQGYGLSDGSPSIQNICLDGTAAFDYATKQLGYPENKIIQYGESLGCAVASQVSTTRNCCALILESPFSSLKIIAGEHLFILRAYPTALFPKPLLNNLAILQAPHPPLIIFHGEQDLTIPVSHGKELFEKAAQPKRLVLLPNSTHCVAEADHQLFMNSLNAFLASLKNPS